MNRTMTNQRTGSIVAAITEAIPEPWNVFHEHTGGGCTAWCVYYGTEPQERIRRGWILLTGADYETEASSDLSRGVCIGAYTEDDDGGLPVPGWTSEEMPVYITDSIGDAAACVTAMVAYLTVVAGGES